VFCVGSTTEKPLTLRREAAAHPAPQLQGGGGKAEWRVNWERKINDFAKRGDRGKIIQNSGRRRRKGPQLGKGTGVKGVGARGGTDDVQGGKNQAKIDFVSERKNLIPAQGTANPRGKGGGKFGKKMEKKWKKNVEHGGGKKQR